MVEALRDIRVSLQNFTIIMTTPHRACQHLLSEWKEWQRIQFPEWSVDQCKLQRIVHITILHPKYMKAITFIITKSNDSTS